jgi:hypothetical protein
MVAIAVGVPGIFSIHKWECGKIVIILTSSNVKTSSHYN